MMNIVFFASSTVEFPAEDHEIRTLPSRNDEWENLLSIFPDDNFFVVTQLPSPFLIDIKEDRLLDLPANVKCIISKSNTPQDFAEDIIALNPDVAVQASYWAAPFDWMCLNDSLIAEELCKRGVRTIFHPAESELICFDKWQTHNMIKGMGFNVPDATYVHHELYWAERPKPYVTVNAYKEYVWNQMRNMKYPVVIKDTVGLSSYGMDVAVSFKEAVHYLNLGRTSSDRLVETFIDGIAFGTEIYSLNGKTVVMPPFLLSVNKYGLTSPRRSIKLGPITNPKYKIEELNAMLVQLAQKLNLNGFAQVDLIFKDDRWYVIEVNPRLSGMSETYACCSKLSILKKLAMMAKGILPVPDECTCTCSFKLPLMDYETMKKIKSEKSLLYMYQIKNNAARQERERGYCEVVVGGFESHDDLIKEIKRLSDKYSDLFEEQLFEEIEKVRVLI
ncbi:MAG: ATP-grasp domain-containing protein [Treponema sp.]|nr:ATP-grasp domain-containing protein [Treponema sp.]